MKNKTTFIVTTDKETADLMIAEGFRLVDKSNGKFTFESKPLENFSNKAEKPKKAAYTNILTF